MKRCNNCGWFNLDSVTECEKCGEVSFAVEEISVVEEVTSAEDAVVPTQSKDSVVEESRLDATNDAQVDSDGRLESHDNIVLDSVRNVSEPVAPAPRVEEVAEPVVNVVESVAPAPRVEETVEPVVNVVEPVAPAPRVEEVAEPVVNVVESVAPAPHVEESVHVVHNSFANATVVMGTGMAKSERAYSSNVVPEQPVSTPQNKFNATVAIGSDMVPPVAPVAQPHSVAPERPASSSQNSFKATVAIGSDMVPPVAQAAQPAATSNKFAKATVAIDSEKRSLFSWKSSSNRDVKSVESTPNTNFKATVALGGGVPKSETPNIVREERKEVETIAKATEESNASISCPKCCYPISGCVEYCPNCGATIKSVPVSNVVTAKDERERVNYSKTVRDVSAELKATVFEPSNSDAVYRLIPLDSMGGAAIELREGDVVVIKGERFRFDK